MSKVQAGSVAPRFTLKEVSGATLSLAEALQKGPVLAAFFKVSCPVCQFTVPFLERIFEAYGDAKTTLWGISQDDERETREFCAEYGLKFPVLIDGKGYPASNDYGLTNVPSIYLIAPDGRVLASSVGFEKAVLEKTAAEFAVASGKQLASPFRPGEVVPDFKPG